MRRAALLLLALAGPPVAAQSSPYLPLDHPLTPLVEHLIARGDLPDPSPMVRPFRRVDVVRALDSALAAGTVSDARLARLADELRDPEGDDWVRFEARAGTQAFTAARRDLLHPAGEGATQFYAEGALEARVGPLVLASRPIAENRLKLDPDWRGGEIQQRKSQAYRFADAYLSAQFGKIRLFYGQMARNWGPVERPGIPISSYGYPRSDLGLELRLKNFQLDLLATELTPMVGPGDVEHKRYFVAHRLTARVTKRLDLGIWETAVLAGPNQSFEPYFRNPLVLLAFPVQFGLDDNRNTLLGGDLEWRPKPGLALGAQAAIDDRWRRSPDPDGTGEPAHPGRWAVTVTGRGALGSRASWRAGVSLVNSLAFRTIDSTESFVDRGVGIGPHQTDNALVTLELARPIAGRWLAATDLAVLWQGEGRIDAPFPLGAALTDTPELFIGTTATTYRLGASVHGGSTRFNLRASAGLHHTTNADHVPGASRTRIEARLIATIGFAKGGPVE
ncbi:MAG: hypothetical protein R2909_22030 [Gemmatimonadales bacterium]